MKCVISSFFREVYEICVLLGCYAASSGNYKEGVNFSQKHNCNMAKMMVFIVEQNYMFRPISAIFRFSQLLC